MLAKNELPSRKGAIDLSTGDQATEFATTADGIRRSETMIQLPDSHLPYTDKYFLRSAEILRQEGFNPWVRSQIFLRKGPGEIYGIDTAIDCLTKYTDIAQVGGRLYAKKEGERYQPNESVLIIEAPVQQIVEMETILLGLITSETTRKNDGVDKVDLPSVRGRMNKIVTLAEGRPVIYFGARHWDLHEDRAISLAAFEGGAVGASTDIGAGVFAKTGVGTIPHALENVFAFYYGADSAVVESTIAFNKAIDKSVPRIALIDYNNREISDAVAVARALRGELQGVRVDTCGENVAEGALRSGSDAEANLYRSLGFNFPSDKDADARYWYGNGVTVSGVFALRRALDAAGFPEVEIILTSGFGDPVKVAAFVRAEKILGVRLFDSLGVGGIYEPCRTATMDIVGVGDGRDLIVPLAKVGRRYRPNPSLGQVRFTDRQVER